MPRRSSKKEYPKPGEVISIQSDPFTRHFGIVTDRYKGGKPTVIHASKFNKKVREDSFQEFTDGPTWTGFPRNKRSFRRHGIPGSLSSKEAIVRARRAIGRPYNLFTFNCEQFVRWAHGMRRQSPQLSDAFDALTRIVLSLFR